MTSLPDWLVERAALDEVAPASSDRIERADPRELADRVAALREDNAAELARHPAGPAVAQIEARVAAEARQRTENTGRRRRRRLGALGLATSTAAVLVVARFVAERPAIGEAESPGVGTPTALPAGRGASPVGSTGDPHRAGVTQDDGTRVKGAPRLVAFRQIGGEAERLEEDAVVRAGDVIQLRYNAGGQGYGVIASVDGAGGVTLHFPLREDASPEATAVARDTTALPNAYALDDAPRFERFFFITASGPVDVQEALAALRSLARRDDSATASLDLPAGLHQWSLRLRKPDRTSTHHESP